MPVMLSFGARGQGVKDLQNGLNSRPPTSQPPLAVDGIFGPKTLARVKEFQRNHGLTPDGIVGPLTWGALISSSEVGFDLEEFQNLCDYAVSTLRKEFGYSPWAAEQGVAYFNQRRRKIQAIGFPTGGGPAVGAIGVGAVVIVALVLIAFAFAVAIIMEGQKNTDPAEINRLINEFGKRMAEIEAQLSSAGIDAVILLAVAMSAVEQAVRAQVESLRRHMERCRQNNPREGKCRDLAMQVEAQMNHVVQQAILTSLLNPARIRELIIGLARSLGFLMKLISRWARCMECEFLNFFEWL